MSTQTEAHSASGSERPGDTDNVHTVPTTGGIPITQDSTAGWQRRYSRRLLLSDAIILVFVVFGAQIIWFDNGQARLNILRDTRISDISYWIFSAILILAWLWALSLADSRSRRVIGTGTTEYRRVVDPSLRVFGLIAILAFLLQIDSTVVRVRPSCGKRKVAERHGAPSVLRLRPAARTADPSILGCF